MKQSTHCHNGGESVKRLLDCSTAMAIKRPKPISSYKILKTRQIF